MSQMTEQLPSGMPETTVSGLGSGTRQCLGKARHGILGDDTLLDIKEVAQLVGVSPRQIYKMMHRQRFPGPKKLGALSRWRLGVIRQWLRADEMRRC
jgi:predicted DNA-binding transcriptional regulator AlpA